MSPEPISNTPVKKLPFNRDVPIRTLNIGDSVTISASTPFNWDGDMTFFSFYADDSGNLPICVGFRPGDQGTGDDEGKRGRLSLNARIAHSDGWPLPWDDIAWLSELFIEGEHAWFTIKSKNEFSYDLTFPTGKTINFGWPNTYPGANLVRYELNGYDSVPSVFPDAVIQ